MKEATFYNVYARLPLEEAHIQRIEVSSGRGVPDVNLCYKGREIWMELKVAIRGKAYVRKEQYVWGLRRAKHGGVVLLVCYNEGTVEVWRYPFPVIHIPKYCHPDCPPTWTTRAKDFRERILDYLSSLHR